MDTIEIWYDVKDVIAGGQQVAKTKAGKKIVDVPEHKRAKLGGTYKKVVVRRHRRSTPE